MNKEKEDIILRLNAKKADMKIYHSILPEKYKNDREIILAERELGVRKIHQIGFDVINQVYFVYENVLDIDEHTGLEVWIRSSEIFNSFENFYDYLDGNIYENACYYQCDLSCTNRKIDFSRLPERNSFIDYTIDDYTLSPTESEIQIYKNGAKTHSRYKEWIEKCRNCSTSIELDNLIKNYNKSKIKSTLCKDSWIYNNFIIWIYIAEAIKDENKFITLMDYVSIDTNSEGIVRELCTIFNPDKVIERYMYGNDYNIGYKQKKRIKDFALALKHGQIKCTIKAFFDARTHLFCEQKIYNFNDNQLGINQSSNKIVTCRFFETFDEFVDYRNGDLSNTDLSGLLDSNIDFSLYRKTPSTILPIQEYDDISLEIKKVYTPHKGFGVTQTWCDSNGTTLKHYEHSFLYFFDFVAFLKGDLSNADLVFCNGITNLRNISNLRFDNSELTSDAYERFGIKYEKITFDNNALISFDCVRKNELSTELILHSKRLSDNEDELDMFVPNYDKERIHYISDLHLMHKLQNKNAKNKNDIIRIITSMVDTVLSRFDKTIIIVGDISSDYYIYEIFIRTLRRELDKCKWRKADVIFVLGNHDLWSFPDYSFDSLVEKYRSLLSQNGMYLLQNEILYKDQYPNISNITEKELLEFSPKKIRKILNRARLILFGGLAFSGFNQEFNADNGIYRNTINRLEEQGESLKFCEIYEKIVAAVPDRKVVVATHMPMDCWKQSVEYQKGYVYVSGHTHRNYFYDDGDIRIYSDNQIGYRNNTPYLKWFDVDTEYDCFSDYSDGIYKISKADYQDFYRGKNIMISFNRTVFVLYMLKKNGYYCFIHESRNGSLCILNGGTMKKLDRNDINYYYDNMDQVISLIKSPLDAYTKVQEQIADEVLKIGGSGKIHGCIVDIDFFNHIYLNPLDMKITGYNAINMIYKKIYPSIPSLLKSECPMIYANYQRYVKGVNKNSLVMVKKSSVSNSTIPQMYLETDIYKASREIKKMQKLHSNILSTWPEQNRKNKRIGS